MDMKKNHTSPGEGLRTLRNMAGLTLDAVASEAGVSAAYLSKVETGQTQATPKWIGMVAEVIAAHLKAVA